MGVALVALAVVVASAIAPRKLGGRLRIEIGPATVPPLVLLILIAIGTLSVADVERTIIGTGESGAWRVLVLFYSVAYASTSTDVTGIFDFIAYRVLLAAGGSGRKLLIGVYFLASILTVFSSNDIVILTLTPIVYHIGQHAKVDVKPLLFAEFLAANTLSMLLVIGNPTNIIIANRLGIGFLPYLRVMWLPSLCAFIGMGVMLLAVFGRSLPKRIELHPDAMFRVRNWLDAWISVALFVALFAGFVLADLIGTPLWLVALVIAASFTVEDLAFTVYYALRSARSKSGGHPHRFPRATLGDPAITLEEDRALRLIPETTNDLYLAHMRVPWKILPFIVVSFVLVDVIGRAGAAELVGSWLSGARSTIGAALRSGLFSTALANLTNNQPTSIFVAEALATAPSSLVRTTAAYAAIIASNLAANLTLVGALAGLMWRRILETKGTHISYLEFLSIGVRIVPPVLAVALVALAIRGG